MAQSVRINDGLAKSARTVSIAEHRSMAGQLEHSASIGRAAEENPDLPFSMLREILLAKVEVNAGMVENYVFGEGD